MHGMQHNKKQHTHKIHKSDEAFVNFNCLVFVTLDVIPSGAMCLHLFANSLGLDDNRQGDPFKVSYEELVICLSLLLP